MNFIGSKNGVLFVNKEDNVVSKDKNVYIIDAKKHEFVNVFCKIIQVDKDLNLIEFKVLRELFLVIKHDVDGKFGANFVKSCAKKLYISMNYVRGIIAKLSKSGVIKRTKDGFTLSDKYNIYKNIGSDIYSDDSTKSIIINFN